MKRNESILQELNELNSRLLIDSTGTDSTYTVPVGYFDELAEQVLTRIRLSEKTNELFESPYLDSLSKQNIYTVPTGYFEGLAERMMEVIRTRKEYKDVAEETEAISPLLASLKKETPYKVPHGYFEGFTNKYQKEEIARPAKVVSMYNRKWFRVAAAAMITAIVAITSWLIIDSNKVSANEDSYAWVKKSTKKVSTEKLDEFIQLTDNEQTVASADVKGKEEVKELIKDVPDEEIMDLLKDTRILDDENNTANAEETLMN